ncbi:MAG TPA: hemolysin family protein [Candidatus Binataceae bacterium]|nr:hemolysin family protein [Candidatus Binataceae bacterium]
MLLLLVIVLLGVSALLAASETALFALARMQHTRASLGEAAARAVDSLLRRPLESLVVIIGFNEAINVFAECLATVFLLTWLGPPGGWISVPVMFVLVLLVSDITPKTVALGFPDAVARIAARPLAAVALTLHPLARLFVPEEAAPSAPLSESEFKALLIASERLGQVAPAERELIDKVFAFGARRVSEIMTPRDRIFALDLDTAVDRIIAEVAHGHYSRVPVYRGNPNNIVGVLRAKDLVARRLESAPPRLERLIREPYFVPPGKTLGQLFDEMRRQHFQLAFIVDEYGHLLGLVTLEDLLEELFGELRDEFELEGPDLTEAGGGEWLAAGTIGLARLTQALDGGESFAARGHERTLSSLVLRRLGRVPQPGERLRLGGFETKIEKVRGATIELVRLKRCS